MAVERSGSVLAADFGSVYTRAVLLDVVDGAYRMVARGETRTTAGYPVDDIGVGLDRVLSEISEMTGRKLLDKDGKLISPERIDRAGVDHFLATVSIGRPLRTVLVGLVPGVSIASGARAASRTYVQVVETLHLEDGRSEEERLNAVILSRPDLIFITGGTEAGAQNAVLQLARVARLGATLIDKRHKPLVLFAGNSTLAERIKALFEGVATVLVSSNVRPSLDSEMLEGAQVELSRAFNDIKAKGDDALKHIAGMSKVGVFPTAQSYSLLVNYLAKTTPGGVAVVDVGSAVGMLGLTVDGQISTSVRTDIGLGHSAYSLVQAAGLERVQHWLPFNPHSQEIINYALNKTLRPATVPINVRDLYLEHALLKAGIETMLADSLSMAHRTETTYDMIVGAGSGLTRTGHPAYTALLLLDALQPIGITRLYADPNGLIAALGALALVNPEAVVQVLDGRNLEMLGTSVAASGEPRVGKPALKIKIVIDRESFENVVNGGELWTLPLGTSRQVEVDIRVVGRGLTIGGKSRVKLKLEGGTAGLIFDARGRPLPLAKTARGRAAQIPAWVSQMTGDPAIVIDESWLDEGVQAPPVTESQKIVMPVEVPKPKRGLFGRGRGKQPDKAPQKTQEVFDEEAAEALGLLDDEEAKKDDLGDLRGDLLS